MPTEQTDTTQTPPEEITYTPTVWADGEDGGTPINAANMNNIEEAIVALVERTTKQVVTSMIADGAVTNLKLSPELQDLLSCWKPSPVQEGDIRWRVLRKGDDAVGARIVFYEGDMSSLIGYVKLIE